MTDDILGGRHRAPDRPPATSRWRPVVRRSLDIVVAAVALLLVSVPMLVIAILVRTTSPGPALFRQTRVGQYGRRFAMLKFRTMHVGCSDETHRMYVTRLLNGEVQETETGVYKLDADPRVTRVGRVLRRTSADELPQLFNVLRGEMSLVGPRPMLPWECDMLAPAYRDRFVVPAGMTGLWQVSGRSALSMTEALDLDVRYARSAGLLLDIAILARTVWVVLVPRGRAQ